MESPTAHARGETAMRGILHIDIGHIRAGEGASQSRLDRAVQHKLGPGQQPVPLRPG